MRRNKASGLRCVQYGRHCTGYEAFLVAVNEAESKSKHVVLQNSTLKFLIPLKFFYRQAIRAPMLPILR
jgi:hypothetical protein